MTNSAKSRLLLISLTISILVSCKKADFALASSSGQTLIGKWQWKESNGGIAGASYTPASTNKQIVIEYSAEGIYREYVNDKNTYEDYYVILEDTSLTKPSQFYIQYQNKSRIQQWFRFENNELILIDPCCDLFVSDYVRVK